jgi:response regulator RpfG family c-di-GMP phosphodiesterase
VARQPPQGLRVLDRLLQDQRISREQYESAVMAAHRSGDRADEALLDTGIMREADLLKWIATTYKTRFVSTEKLARADIDRTTLERLPRRVAEKLLIFPILFDAKANSLSVVAADLEEDVAKNVQLATGVRDVKVYAGRPGAIRAAILKFYGGDAHAFSRLDAGGIDYTPGPAPLDPYERNGGPDLTRPDLGTFRADSATGSGGHGGAPSGQLAPSRRATPAPLGGRGAGIVLRLDAENDPRAARRITQAGAAEEAAARGGGVSGGIPPTDWLEMINVLVALLENGRAELRGHSSQVARMMRRVCERIGLPEREMTGILGAAYLHDVGKASNYHLTAMNVAEYEGHRLQAQKMHTAPLRLLESVKLPESCVATITHLYERFDGTGFPDRLSGKDIPIGARLLAIVETYADLVQNARNPFRKTLSAKEANDVLAAKKGSVFDPNLVDLFSAVVLGDDLRRRLEGRARALIVDADPEDTTVLELRLVEHGYDTIIARNAADARKALESQDVDIVISEVDLTPHDGFTLLEQLRSLQKTASIPFIFLTRRSDRESVQRGFALGAVDYLVKPTSADVLVAKARQIIEGAAARGAPTPSTHKGVSGSLTEMALPDVVQILAHGRKSGQLRVSSKGQSGEVLFLDGQIHHATFGPTQGDDAFYKMLNLTSGEFALDPDVKPTTRTVNASVETLLLEGLRRLDEGK